MNQKLLRWLTSNLLDQKSTKRLDHYGLTIQNSYYRKSRHQHKISVTNITFEQNMTLVTDKDVTKMYKNVTNILF